MTDYMDEAERLADEYAKAVHDGRDSDCVSLRAALLAHIQRGVPEGWRTELLNHFPLLEDEGLDEGAHHCEWAVQQERKRLHAMLSAAPDHFRDAAEMVAEPAHDRIAAAIHYPECWDTAAYPTVESALSEVFAHYRCTEHAAPAEVPMPEPVAIDGTSQLSLAGCMGLGVMRVTPSYSELKMRTYGSACRAAGEAAGYARGRADERERCADLCEAHAGQRGTGAWTALTAAADRIRNPKLAAADAALRGEVKP